MSEAVSHSQGHLEQRQRLRSEGREFNHGDFLDVLPVAGRMFIKPRSTP